MRYVPIDEVRAGDVLAAPLYNEKGLMLLNAGHPISLNVLNAIKGRGISQIAIEDEETAGIIITRPVSGKTEIAIIQGLKNLEIEKIQESAKTLVEELIEARTGIADMQVIKTYDEYTYQHSYSVGYLSAIVGLASNLKVEEVINLTIAGLLHDLGKICIDVGIINAPRKLTEDEFGEIKKHPLYGYNMLKDKSDIPAVIRVPILQHHENEDGSGYPRHIKGDAIHRFTKIIHICDVFDALTSNRSYREPISRKEAVQYILDNTSTMFSKSYASVFKNCIPIHPVGERIILPDRTIAYVVSNQKDDINNPTLCITGSLEQIRLKDAVYEHTA